MYGGIAAFGLTAISSFLVNQQIWLRLFGGVFLCYLGVRTFLSHPSDNAASLQSARLGSVYSSTFLLTLTNPTTILSFAAIFAGVGLGSGAGDPASAAMLVTGVFAGSALWWLILSSGISVLRAKLTSRGLLWVNRTSGIVLSALGLLALLSLVSLLL